MKRQISLCVVSLLGLLFLPAGAVASTVDSFDSKAVCTPDTQTRGGTVTATVTFTNRHADTSFTISKYALMQHFGGLSFSGPKNTAFASPIAIPHATQTDGCPPFGCFFITPSTASTTINFTVPVSVLPKQLVNTGFGFWGTTTTFNASGTPTGGDTNKKLRSATGCSVEAQ